MDPESERDLVRRLKQGDTDAFDEIYDAYRARLFGFLLRLVRHRDVAEDLLEETWLRLVTRARGLRPDTRLAAWLFTVARNLHASYRRSRWLDSEALDEPMQATMRSRDDSPFEVALGVELAERLEDALAQLPLPYREVLLLVTVDGFSPTDAASVCGVTPEALRQRLSRARAMLARLLDQPGPSVRVRTTRSAPEMTP